MAFAERYSSIPSGGFVQIQNDHVGAVAGEGGSGGAADSSGGCGAGDDCDFALKKHERNL
jgi:hypothetical protein